MRSASRSTSVRRGSMHPMVRETTQLLFERNRGLLRCCVHRSRLVPQYEPRCLLRRVSAGGSLYLGVMRGVSSVEGDCFSIGTINGLPAPADAAIGRHGGGIP